MKKLIILCCLLFIAAYSFAQYPQPPQNIGGLNIVVRDTGGLFVRQTFTPPQYTDTVQANANNYTSKYAGSLIFTTNDNTFWVRNFAKDAWLSFFNNGNAADTLFAEQPLFFDSTSHPGSTIIKILRPNGIVSGGTVTVDSCRTLDVVPTIVSINYIQYSSPATVLTVPASDVLDRVDEVIDSLGYIILRTGVPSLTPVAKPYDPSIEVVLATYRFTGGASCIDINQIIVWDQNVGTPTEFALTTSGTISANGNNTDKPKHLTKAIFVSSYASGASLIFTQSSTLTAQASELFKFWVYLNGAFGSNQFIVQFYNGSNPVGNPVAFGAGFGFNPNDSNEYQQVVMPFSAFNLTNQTFDKVVISFFGNDLSGAKGLYIDYIQLQTGATNAGTQLVLTTIGASGAATYNPSTNILNIPIYGGGAGNDSVYVDATSPNDTTIDLRRLNGNHTIITIQGGGNIGVNVLAPIGAAPNANAATLTAGNTTLNLQPASVDFGGVVTASATPQYFLGQKSIVSNTDTLLTAYAGTTRRTALYSTGAQAWYVLNVGTIANGFPNGFPGILFENQFDSGRSQIRQYNALGGISIGSLLNPGIPDNQFVVMNNSHTFITGRSGDVGGGGAAAVTDLGYMFNVAGTSYLSDSLNLGRVPTGAGSDSLLTINNKVVRKIAAASLGGGTVTSIGLTSSDITVGGSSPITTSGTYTLTLPTINSNVGSFTNANITVDGKGRITAAANGSAGTGSTNLNIGSGYRFAVPNTNNIKTLFSANTYGVLDSTTNTNALTYKVDTTVVMTVNSNQTNITGQKWFNNALALLPQAGATTPAPTGLTIYDSVGFRITRANGFRLGLSLSSLTANRSDSFPDKSGTFAMTSDIVTQTTNKLRVTATAGQTAFTFAGLPTSTNNYDIYINGAYVNPTFYSGSGTTVTFTSGLIVGDVVDYAEKK